MLLNRTLQRLVSPFLRDDDGAVTVDWVVLTAVIVVLGSVVVAIIRPGVYVLATDIYSNITVGL